MGWSHNLCKDLGNYRYDALTTSWVKAYQDAENVRDGAETQKQINDKSVRVFESIADLLTYTPRKDGQVVYVKGYHNPTNFALAKPYVGGVIVYMSHHGLLKMMGFMYQWLGIAA